MMSKSLTPIAWRSRIAARASLFHMYENVLPPNLIVSLFQ
jgi:hypothetical protein